MMRNAEALIYKPRMPFVQPASAFGSSIKHRGMVLQTKIGRTIVRPQVYSVFIVTVYS